MSWLIEQPPLADPKSFVFAKWLLDLWRFLFYSNQVVTVTTTYNAKMEDAYILGDTTGGAFTVTMPNAAGNKGKTIIIKRTTGANTITVARRDSETIDGATSDSVTTAAKRYISDNSNWWTW